MPKPRLNELAKQSLAQLRADGIELSDVDVIIIYQLARRALECAPQSELLRNTGTSIGKLTIYPLTLGAKLWLSTEAIDWFADDPGFMSIATVYAMAHSREMEAFNFTDAKTAKHIITAWGMYIDLTEKEIMQSQKSLVDELGGEVSALEIVQSLVDQIRTDPTYIDLSAACSLLDSFDTEPQNAPLMTYMAVLAKNYHQEREHWLWNESDDFCMELVREARKMEKQDSGVDPFDPCAKAYRQLMGYVDILRSRHASG